VRVADFVEQIADSSGHPLLDVRCLPQDAFLEHEFALSEIRTTSLMRCARGGRYLSTAALGDLLGRILLGSIPETFADSAYTAERVMLS
jgi:hypothetical protein